MPPHEVRIFASFPTTTNELFAYVTPLSELEEPEVLEVQDVPLGQVRIIPVFPTTTKVLFP